MAASTLSLGTAGRVDSRGPSHGRAIRPVASSVRNQVLEELYSWGFLLTRLAQDCISSSPQRPALVRATAAAQRKGAVDAIGQQTIADEKKYLVQTYARPDMVIESGEGSTVTDTSGRTYLDFYSGIAVNALGHGHPAWLSAVNRQAGVLCHTSNAFHTRPQVELAKKLVSSSFADRVFFANTGTEANEAAIKFARKFAKVHAGLDPYDASSAQEAPCEIVSFTGSFHGRTMGSLALTYKDRYRTPFAPLMPHARMLPYGDVAAARAAVKKGATAAVVVEPVQGEGGIHPAPPGFLEALRRLCDEAGALLVFDEVQVGLGRTGTLWAHEQFGVEPDMMSLAKPLAGGLPIGVLLVKERVAEVMDVGDHGSTFAGNPFVCAAANAVLGVIAEPAFLREVRRKGDLLVGELRGVLGGNSHVREVRGRGLIVGVQLDAPAAGVVAAARELGLLVITAGAGDVIRIVPPLVVRDDEIKQAARILAQALDRALS